MAEANISEESAFKTDFSILKAAHLKSFSSESLKVRLFIL